jgi:hypothetical protein
MFSTTPTTTPRSQTRTVRLVSASAARHTGGEARRRTRWAPGSARSRFAGLCTSVWSRASRACGLWNCNWE